MTDHQQAAIEAAAKAMADDWNPDRDTILTAMFRDHADSAIAAAEPHLHKKWAEELERAMFKVESMHHFGFGEGGIKCLCGFESARNRSRTEHITQAVRDLVEGAGE